MENMHLVSSTREAKKEVSEIHNQKNLVMSHCRGTKLEAGLTGLEQNFNSEAF